jgi:glycosyltransferase involved in cell wall biosynthesis
MTLGAIWISYESLGASIIFFLAHFTLPILFSIRARKTITNLYLLTLSYLNRPKVTVIIASHNCMDYLEQAVGSALSSVGVKVKVLIVDDASTDGSLELSEKLSSQDKRVQVIKNKTRRGAYFCRNVGLLKANTEFIAFLDSDDVHEKNRLILQIMPMKRNRQIQATYCLGRRWAEDLSTPIEIELQRVHASSVFRRSLVSRIGFFDVVSFGSDTEFRLRIMSIFGEPGVELINHELYKARANPNSLTASGAGKHWSLVDGVYTRTLNQTRFRYQLNWRTWHASEKKPFIGFPIRERLFSAGDNHHGSSPFLGQRVVGFMIDDSIGWKKTNSSILSTLSQVDELHVLTKKKSDITRLSIDQKVRIYHWANEKERLVFNKQIDESQGYILFFNCRKQYSSETVNRTLAAIEVHDRRSYVNFNNDSPLINTQPDNKWKSKIRRDPIKESESSRPNPLLQRGIGFHSQITH